MTKKIMVAMSGGVDSAVVAYLTKTAGHETSAATMHIGNLFESLQNSCCSEQNVADAKQLSDMLGIKHYTVDLTDKFLQLVATPFINTYLNGGTPNPCIECNRHIKFGELLNFCISQGSQKLATGHYAKVQKQNDRHLLCRSSDPLKDQTYVLWRLSQEQLSHVIFPLADMRKEQVREIANELRLPAFEKKESQDICFIPDGNYVSFIERATGAATVEGSFLDTDGRIIGTHKGIIRYTPGQRKGLGISFGEPMYVKSKCAVSNSVTLCRSEQLFTKRISAHQINLIACDKLSSSIKVTAKIRYSQSESSATLIQTDADSLVLEFDTPQRAAATGQSVVIYDGNTVIGGGIID